MKRKEYVAPAMEWWFTESQQLLDTTGGVSPNRDEDDDDGGTLADLGFFDDEGVQVTIEFEDEPTDTTSIWTPSKFSLWQ